MPRCIFGIDYQQDGVENGFGCNVPVLPISGPDFSECPNFIANNCQSGYDACVLNKQLAFINRIMDCLGQEFVWWDVAELISGNVDCYWTITGEYVCPGNPPGIGGFETAIHILEGMHVSSVSIFQDDPFGCYDLVICTYYPTVCVACENAASACCD